MIALVLGGCAAGEGQDTENPFSSAPHSQTGDQVTEGADCRHRVEQRLDAPA